MGSLGFCHSIPLQSPPVFDLMGSIFLWNFDIGDASFVPVHCKTVQEFGMQVA